MSGSHKVTIVRVCLAVLCWIFLVTGSVQAAPPRTQYIFMVDTSGSMVGLPEGSGAIEIFPRVQAEIVSIVEDVELGDTVDIITFDKGVQSRGSWNVSDELTRKEVIQHISSLRADGASTWVYQSIREIVQQTVRRHREWGAPELPTDFFVFTDGRDNHPDKKTMSEMLDDLADISREHDYLYYVTLGIELGPEDEDPFEKYENFTIVSNPPGVLHKIRTIRIRAKSLDFGFVEGELSVSRDLVVQAENIDSPIHVEIKASFSDAEDAGSVILVEPEVASLDGMNQVQLRIHNRDSLPERHFTGELHFDGSKSRTRVVPNSIPVRFKTLGEPIAELILPDNASELDFGAFDFGESIHASTIVVDFSQSAVDERSHLYAWIKPSEQSAITPSLSFNGSPIEPDTPLIADRINSELRVEWGGVPEEARKYQGEIILTGEGLTLEGVALRESSSGRHRAIGYQMQIESPPAPLWLIALLALGGLLLVLIFIALVAWFITGEPPWVRLRRSLVQFGLLKPSLSGKLVANRAGRDRMELQLRGNEPIILGEGGTVWQELPGQIEIRPQLRKNKEVAFASRKKGKMTYQARGEVNRRPLSGQNLNHGDIVILSDGTEIQYLEFRL